MRKSASKYASRAAVGDFPAICLLSVTQTVTSKWMFWAATPRIQDRARGSWMLESRRHVDLTANADSVILSILYVASFLMVYIDLNIVRIVGPTRGC